MFKLLYPLPKRLTVALSGGVDSIAAVDFLSKNHDVTCAFYHHGTENSENALKFVSKFCTDRNLPMMLGWLNKEKPKDMSYEEFWREERYNFLEPLGPVVTAHHLDDAVETYLWSAMHGSPRVPKVRRNDIMRPFLATPKKEFINWCLRKDIQWCEDLSNDDVSYTRNYIRKNLMPHALRVNPGLHTVVKKMVERQV